MRKALLLMAALMTGGLALADAVAAQERALTDAECQGLRRTMAGHAQVSDGVRRLLGVSSPPAVVAAPATTATAPAGRADAIRTRLGQIPTAREQVQAQRVAAVMKFDMSGAMRAQVELENLDQEKANLEKELAALPVGPATPVPTPSVASPPASPDVDRIRCQDVTGMHARAIRIRQKELGAREDQVGAIPLLALKGPGSDQIARELGSQFAPWPAAAAQVGLLDQDGDGRLDGFVDVPAEGTFRLYRQGSDGSVTVQTYVASASAQGYGETARRLDETIARQTGQSLPDLLSRRPAGPVLVVGETAGFARAFGSYVAGDFAEAARRDSAARTRQFQNLRGETVRVMDVIAPTSTGLSVRQLVVLSRPNDQELWEETATQVTTTSWSQADVEMTTSRETRTVAGAVVGARSTTAPVRFRVDR